MQQVQIYYIQEIDTRFLYSTQILLKTHECPTIFFSNFSTNVRTDNHFGAGLGIRSFAHCSFAHFAQIKWATVSESLRLLRGKERPWANRSGRSRKMSDHERFTQVTQRKWANGQFAQIFWQKKNIKSSFTMFYFRFKKKIFRKNKRIAHFCSFPLFW